MPGDKGENIDTKGDKSLIKDISWQAVACGSNCSVVDVKDGKMIRIRPLHFDWKYDPEEFNPWKIEAHSDTFEPSMKSLIPPLTLSYKKRAFSPSRVLYPLKRVDFNPKEGERNPQNRGKTGFKRISWEEALDIIESEMKRIKEEYGPEAILYESDQHGENKVVHGPHGCARKLLDLWGGYTLQVRDPDSWEGYSWGTKHVWGCQPVGQQVPQTNTIPDVAKNAELLLYWGCDNETTPWGWQGQLPSRLSFWFTELGIEQIFVCPDLNYSAAVHADKWIPIRPNTDAALYLAIAYVWITEDSYDKEYIETHSHGFDKFKEYVLGNEDENDFPKTPEWAEGITGVPARRIKALARKWASKTTSIVIGNGGPGIRGPYSTEPARLQALLLAMQGLGKPGVHQVKMIEWNLFYMEEQAAMPKPAIIPDGEAAYTGGHPNQAHKESFIPEPHIHDAILNPPISWYGCVREIGDLEQFNKYEYPMKGNSKIHMIWTDSPKMITCWNDGHRMVKAFRNPEVEFILAQHPWMENDCYFADLILPVSTVFEQADVGMDIFNGNFITVFPQEKCIEPLGESKSDYEIVCEIADRLDLLEEYTDGKSVDELIRLGLYEESGIKDMVDWETIEENGYWVVPTDPDWEKQPAGLREFYEDPDENPLDTPTGKIEFESTALKERFPDDEERPPVPHWIPYGQSHQESLEHPRSEDYPYLVVSNHPRWGVHSQHEDISWLREIPTCKVRGPDGYQYQPVWLHPVDAEEKGVSDGEVVKIYNERGAVLAGARVTERIMPGVVYIEHGAKYDPIVPGELDRGGAINSITPHNTCSKNAPGGAWSGFLVDFERANLDELRRKYPDAFERPYDRDSGPTRESFMVGLNR